MVNDRPSSVPRVEHLTQTTRHPAGHTAVLRRAAA